MTDQIPPNSRLASRVILINQDKQILYLHATEPKSGKRFWLMPGGGLEPGESFEDAAKREAYEETGCLFNLGPCVWFRRHKHIWNGKLFDQYERFFVALTIDSSYKPSCQDAYVSDHKWWSLQDLQASNEEFSPRKIVNILSAVLNGDYPESPFDCGV